MSILHKLRLATSCALVGSALSGVAFGGLHLSVDVHMPGAVLGTLTGLFYLRKDLPAPAAEPW